MEFSDEVKETYWQYLSCMKEYRLPGLTDKRMLKLKKFIWNDEFFWNDIIMRHGGGRSDPSQLLAEVLEHCVCNFFHMLHESAYRMHMIKG